MEWDPDNALIDELDLSDSGEESEEHNSDDVNFYHDSSKDHNKEEGVCGARQCGTKTRNL